jgi:hypothetical protein
MKDIFIDNNIAKNFSNPMDVEYQNLIRWLRNFDEDNDPERDNCAFLVLSQKLQKEYIDSTRDSAEVNGIQAIVTLLTEQGRINRISNKQIKGFQEEHFTKKLDKDLKLNRLGKDRDHIPAVLLSERKYAIAIDKNFRYALLNFPRFKATVVSRPEELNYEE